MALKYNTILVYDYNTCGVYTSEVIHIRMKQLMLGKTKLYNIPFISGIIPNNSKQLRVSYTTYSSG